MSLGSRQHTTPCLEAGTPRRPLVATSGEKPVSPWTSCASLCSTDWLGFRKPQQCFQPLGVKSLEDPHLVEGVRGGFWEEAMFVLRGELELTR